MPSLDTALFSRRVNRDDAFDKSQFPTHGGVYALVDENDEVIQLTACQSLRRSLNTRLLTVEPTGTRRTDLSAITRSVCWEPTYSQFESALKYHHIARALYPNEYRKMCAFGPVWFAVLDMTCKFPRWRVHDNPFAGRSACVGPFQLKSHCESFVHALEDLYSLCRYHHILEKTPNGEACAYYEMGRCPAPCDGSIPWSDYLAMLDASMELLRDPDVVIQRTSSAMKQASVELAFERASRLKHDLESARQANDSIRDVPTGVDQLRYLVIQTAGRRRDVKAFMIYQGAVLETGSAALSSMPEVLPVWLEAFENLSSCSVDGRLDQIERIWLTSQYRKKRDRLPGLTYRADEVPDVQQLLHAIDQAFNKESRTQSPHTKQPK